VLVPADRSVGSTPCVAMTMQWPPRTQHCVHRPFKSILGRCILLATFTIVVLLYVTKGSDRRPSTTVIQLSETEQSSLTPAPSEELATPFLQPRPLVMGEAADTQPSLNVSSEVSSSDTCEGRRIFVYEMPAEFNDERAQDCHGWPAWPSMCEDITNHGFGVLSEASGLPPSNAWYRTDQFTLEVIIRDRLKVYPCLTTNPDEAVMFYIPFYPSLDLIRYLYLPDYAARDRLGGKFLAWLRNQAPWQRHHGHRHVLVLGRVYWDFCRTEARPDDTWGSNLVTHWELTNVTKLLIERSPWQEKTVGIPYPTSFHPSSEADVRAWQATVRGSQRRHLVSLAGAKRKNTLTGGIRDAVFDQCGNSTKCNELYCSYQLCVGKPETIVRMGLESVFCLQPPGDTPTRKGLFDSLQAGCIPVVFNQQQAVLQYLFHLPGDGSDYSVLISTDDVVSRNYNVVDHLSRIPQSEIESMRERIVQLLPKLLYRDPVLTGEYTSKDAFDVAIDGLFKRFQDDEAAGELHPTF